MSTTKVATDGGPSERRLLFKIDLLLMPIMTIAYGLQFYDKAILSSASIFGILTDLELSTPIPGTNQTSLQRYSTATSAFYWGYLVAALPMALLVQRFRPNVFLGAAIILWGIIVILTPAIASWRGLIAQRFFLGFVESAVSPGFVLITSMWYKRSECAPRLGIWYSATGLFSMFSSLVNYGFGKVGQRPNSPLAAWKYMFLFAGALTIFFGLVLLALLPSSPTGDALLRIPGYNKFSEEEKSLASRRLESSAAGLEHVASDSESEESSLSDKVESTDTNTRAVPASTIDKRWKLYQVREALCDFKVWIFFLQAIAIYVCNGGVTAFGAYIIRSFGYSSLRSLVLQTPGGATTCVSIYISTYIALKVRNARSILLVITCLPVIAGAAMIWKSDWSNRAIPLAGYYLLPIFGAPFVLMLSMSTANIAGSTKKSIASAMIFIGYNVGNIVAPYLTKAEQKSIHYRDTFVAIITSMSITIALTGILDAGLWYQNRRREERRRLNPPTESEDEVKSRAFADDLTDWENPYFRYVF